MATHRCMAVVLVLALLLICGGCASRGATEADPGPAHETAEEHRLRLVAVMPVDNQAGDDMAAQILRDELLQQLYFKGYPMIPLSFIDERLSALTGNGNPEDALSLPPPTLGSALGVDAILYAALTEWTSSRRLLYGSTEIGASFVLKDARTGALLWQGGHRERDRHVAVTRGRVEAKAYISYEAALATVLEQALETFPDGPEALGPITPDDRPWYQRWRFWR